MKFTQQCVIENTIANTMWYLQFRFVYDKLFNFLTPLLFPVPLPDRAFLQWGSFFFIFFIRLLFYHSPRRVVFGAQKKDRFVRSFLFFLIR